MLQAARLLQRETHSHAGARIHLEKRIPVAAGLGGGSSDAAAALLGLNRLWDSKLSDAQLVELAARLGSDVPCFLFPEPFILGRGRGERCEPLPAAGRLAHVLVVPGERLSTPAVYAGSSFDLTASKPSITMVTHALRNGPAMTGLADGLWNDLEPEAIRRCPIIATIQAHLREVGCLGVGMSGSGTSVFGLCADTTQAHEMASRIRSLACREWRVEIVHTEHPSRVTPRGQAAVSR